MTNNVYANEADALEQSRIDAGTGPLSRLLRSAGLNDQLPPIPTVKPIDVAPVKVSLPGLRPTPEHCSDDTINALVKLCETDRTTLEGSAVANREAVKLMRERGQPAPRMFDLHFEYTSFAPADERWTCIDLNTYDGAPDSSAPATFIGRGASEKQARMDLLAQFAEHDGYTS